MENVKNKTMNLFTNSSSKESSKVPEHASKTHDDNDVMMAFAQVDTAKEPISSKMDSTYQGVSSAVKNSNEDTGKQPSDLCEAMIFFKDDDEQDIGFREENESQQDVQKVTPIENSLEFSMEEQDGSYVANSVEFEEGFHLDDNNVEEDVINTDSDGKEEKNYTTEGLADFDIIINVPPTSSCLFDAIKFSMLEHKFERGVLVQAIDKQGKPFMQLLQVGDALMAYRYVGSGFTIEIPASVGKRPVRYVHHELLRGGFSPFSGVKAQNVKSNFEIENLVKASKDTFKESMKGVQHLILPEGLQMLPPKLFYHCTALTEVTIPSTVMALSIEAFYGSCLRDIWFNGACPKGLKKNYGLLHNVNIHYKKEYEMSFRREE